MLATLLAAGASILALHGRRDLAAFTDESIPFRQALTLWGWGDTGPTANPHFFSYPSLSIYLHWAVQWVAASIGILTGRYGGYADAGVEFALAPAYLVFAARIATALCHVGTAWLAYAGWRDRSRGIGLLAAMTLLTSPPLVRAVMQMPPEAFMGPLVLWTLGVARQSAAPPRLRHVLCGVGAGALCGLKLSALPFLLFVLFVSATAPLARRPGWSRAAGFLAAAGLTFLASSPFALLAWPEFAGGAAFELRHLATGHLGGSRATTAWTHLRQLQAALGPALALMLALLLAHRPARSRNAVLLLIGAATFLVPAMVSSSGAPERYLVPALPLLVLLAWEVVHAAIHRAPPLARVAGWALAAAAVFPLLAGTLACSRPSGPSTVARATQWLLAHSAPDDIVVRDHGACALFSTEDSEVLLRSRCLARATSNWQARAKAETARTVATVPFLASGRLSVEFESGVRGPSEVVVFEPAWMIVPQLYSVLRDVPVQYVVRHAGITSRLESAIVASGRYPGLPVPSGPLEFAARAPGQTLFDDVDIEVYRGAGPDSSGALPAGWWLKDALPPADRPEGGPDRAAYDQAARALFNQRVRPFLLSMADGALWRRDAVALVGSTRLMLISNGDDVTAIRLALIGLAASERQAVWGRDGRMRLTRAAGESQAAWLARALRAWGVSSVTASEETARFLSWRPK